MKRRIIIAGIYRSGSTWLFNVVRLIFPRCYSCFESDYDPENDKPVHVIKAHKFRPDLIDHNTVVLTSWRDLEDIKKSMQRLKDQGRDGNYTEWDDRYVTWFVNWQIKSIYCLDFSRIERCPAKVIDEVALSLGQIVKEKKIQEEIENIKFPNKGIDPLTLFHRDHITRKNKK